MFRIYSFKKLLFIEIKKKINILLQKNIIKIELKNIHKKI